MCYGHIEGWDAIFLDEESGEETAQVTLTLPEAYKRGMTKNIWIRLDWFECWTRGIGPSPGRYHPQPVPAGYDNALFKRVCDWVREEEGSLPLSFREFIQTEVEEYRNSRPWTWSFADSRVADMLGCRVPPTG